MKISATINVSDIDSIIFAVKLDTGSQKRDGIYYRSCEVIQFSVNTVARIVDEVVIQEAYTEVIPEQIINHPSQVIECSSGVHNLLIDFTQDGDCQSLSAPSDGYFITRPLKLGAPDILKTIRSINLRGVFHEESRIRPSNDFQRHTFGMILYGSNDPHLTRWHVLGSVMGSRMQFRYGSPFKAFRLAVISHMKPDESLSHAEIVYELKETDKVR